MEFFESLYYTPVSVPIGQLLMLLCVTTLSLLFGKPKLALLVNYIFTLYWAYIFNRDFIYNLGPETFETITIAYFGFGILSAFLAAFAFFIHREA